MRPDAWQLGFPPFCYCADHPQLSQALSYSKSCWLRVCLWNLTLHRSCIVFCFKKVFVYYYSKPSFILYFLRLFYIRVLVFYKLWEPNGCFIWKSDSVICDSLFVWFYQSQVIINIETVLWFENRHIKFDPCNNFHFHSFIFCFTI